jgi:hypothetical protein
VYEADAGGGAGQRSQKLDAPLGRHEVHHHEVDREGLQVGLCLTNPQRAPSGRWAVWSLPQPHRTWCWSYCVMLTLMTGPRSYRDNLRNFMLLIAIHNPHIRRLGQIMAALAPPVRETGPAGDRAAAPRPGLCPARRAACPVCAWDPPVCSVSPAVASYPDRRPWTVASRSHRSSARAGAPAWPASHCPHRSVTCVDSVVICPS